LNNPGQVTGGYDDAMGTHSFIRNADGTYSKFDIPPEPHSPGPPVPSAINDNGQLAGTAFSGALVMTGFLLSADHMTYTTVQGTSGNVNANLTQVVGVDNNGNVFGTVQFGGSFGLHHGFVRKPDGTFTLIDAPGLLGGTNMAAGNNRGQFVAGNLVLSPDGSTAGLDPTLGGTPMAIDDNGRLAGCTQTNMGCRGFLAVPSVPSGPVIRPVRGVISAVAFGGKETIAPGSWIEIYGSNFSKTTRQWQTSDFNGNTAPTSLDGVSVTINGRRAFVSYISPGQVNAQVPSGLTAGPVQVAVTSGTQTSTGYQTSAASIVPGLLSTEQNVADTYALPVFPDYATFVLPTLVYPPVPPIAPLPFHPAKAGDTLIFYGIGFGNVDPDVPAGQIATQPNALQGSLEVSIGGVMAQVVYAGLAPGSVGLYQFNVVVPDGVQGKTGVDFRLNGNSLPLTLALQP
jgi:uncharacterized protein (TIGR03437 family)